MLVIFKTILANCEIDQTRLPTNVHPPLLLPPDLFPRLFNLSLNHIIHLLVSTMHQRQGHSVKHLMYLNNVVFITPILQMQRPCYNFKKTRRKFHLGRRESQLLMTLKNKSWKFHIFNSERMFVNLTLNTHLNSPPSPTLSWSLIKISRK